MRQAHDTHTPMTNIHETTERADITAATAVATTTTTSTPRSESVGSAAAQRTPDERQKSI
jgi:hypothetical protein